jgi:hypothetical protein
MNAPAIGQRFGKWTVIGELFRRGTTKYVQCACDCGTQKGVNIYNLASGASPSCGCVTRRSGRNRIHGRAGTPDYNRWMHMLRRCHNPRNARYSLYGGRGIAVCDRWRGPDGFLNYIADMGPRPSPKHTVDRVDNDGPYSPENCRWATQSQQCRNRRDSRNITFNGETLNIMEWAERLGMHHMTLRRRLETWSVEKAFTIPRNGTRHYTREERAALCS